MKLSPRLVFHTGEGLDRMKWSPKSQSWSVEAIFILIKANINFLSLVWAIQLCYYMLDGLSEQLG